MSKKWKRQYMRGVLYFQLAGLALLLLICFWLAFRLGAWHTLFGKGRITADSLLAAAAVLLCAANIYICARLVLRTVADLEKSVNSLREEAEKTGMSYAGAERASGSLTELMQFLLQREASAKLMTKRAEINALQNQINPHFLYNTLETIRGQALCSGEIQIAETTKALADIFRYSISKKGALIHLSEELANIDSYIKIQRTRFNDKFELDAQIDEDTRQILIPKLLVQPVIENALIHGLEPKSGKGRIILRAFRTERGLEISVEDDGVGIEPEKLILLGEKLSAPSAPYESAGETNRHGKKMNIGLENVNERIKLIYGPNYGVSVISAQDAGTKVTLSLAILPQE